MSLVAPVKDGKIQDVTTDESSTTTKSTSTLDKQAFLQLLVAQMKYQDPLEPTSNTEYVSQLATFSSLEEMQNMRSSMDLQRASGLVGQEVYVRNTDSKTGETSFVQGTVDFVQYENGKAYLSINETLYSLDDLDSVYYQDYSAAYKLAYNFTVALNKVPAVDKITINGNGTAIDDLQKTFEGMTDYQKTFLTEANTKKYESLVAKLKELREAAEAQNDASEDDSDDEGENSGEDTE